MKGIIYLIILFPFISVAQKADYTKIPAVGVHQAFIDFKGAENGSDFGRFMKPALALNFQNSFSKRFDYSITLAGSFLEFPDGKNGSLGNGKKQLLLESDFSIRARLLKSPALFNPYVQAGLGWSQYHNQYGLYSPVGLGLQVNVTPDIFLLANSQYRIPVTSLQHQHFFHSIGIAGAISRKKIVHVQPAPLPPPVISKTVPTDIDGDGILDNLDSCPQIAGVIRYHGCPIPDLDGDGIFDEEDQCPDIKGAAAYKGCLMPDKDMDGVADTQDKCPDMAGGAVSGGCPEIETLKSMVNWAAQHIFFETASCGLLPRSFPPLDSVINLLQKYPVLQLTIEGHTDKTGTPANNKLLSENRARSVMNYLIGASINTSRLQAKGFGQDKPIADNSTWEGRAINRRVELRVY